MSDFLLEMGVLSHARAACLDEVALDALAHHRPPPPVLDTEQFGVIAEIKFSAPSAGVLRSPADPIMAAVERALTYEAAGAHAISVLTEPTRFGGSLEHLAAVAAAVDIPVMRKDFLVDPAQVLEARAHGAAGVLLILRMLDDVRLDQMVDLAQELGLFVLLEAFDRDDLDRAGRYPGAIVGLNCRDLSSLQVDMGRLESLQAAFPEGVCRVAESGLSEPSHARKVASLGYGLALVGSALMRSDDPKQLVADMTAAGREESCTFM
jgi:indole-3-glycerol phosphate synthase